MPKNPVCPDCDEEMMAHLDGFHGLFAIEPGGDPELGRYYPVVVFQCILCGLVRLYSARLREPEVWTTTRLAPNRGDY